MNMSINQAQMLACPSTEGGASGSGGPAEAQSEEQEQAQDEEEILLEGDLPPDHYLTHRPKMVRCEACQEAKMYHRQRRRVRSVKAGPCAIVRKCLET